MASHRWKPGDLVFQGGTSLHLAHGSPRFSEDLGFLVDWLPGDTRLTVSKAKEDHNPDSFIVSIGGPDVIGSVRVKVELWRTPGSAVAAVRTHVAPVKLARGPAAGMQTFVPTADLQEVYVDKVFALAARPYLKPRDVFDLHWMGTHENLQPWLRLKTYPGETPSAWIEKALERLTTLKGATAAIASDLKRWLPSSWPVNDTAAQEMAAAAAKALEQGILVMREIEARPDETPDIRH